MEESHEKIIVLRAYDTVVEANLAKTKLDAYGIPCFLTDENFTGMYPLRNSVFPGVRLHIFEDDGDEALRILGDIDRHEGFICCPNCGSHDHQHHLNSWERFSLFSAGIFGLIFQSLPSVDYQCMNCKTVFRVDGSNEN